MRKNRNVKGTRVPTPLCIAFILMFGVFSVCFACIFPQKIVQYNIRKNLVENGKVVNATYDEYWINVNTHAPNIWSYRIRYCYVENDINYSIVIQSGQETNVDTLENSTVKILIDGKGNCVKEGTTKGNLFVDALLYVLLWGFFTVVTGVFTAIAIINIRAHIYKKKLRYSENQNDTKEKDFNNFNIK